MKRWDAVIVGSGISSLTTAALLARKGRSVCVLEQHPKPGGYLHCFKRFGERYDTGAHYVGAMDPGEPFHTLLRYLGVGGPDIFVPLDPEGFDELRFPTFSATFARGYERTIALMSERFPSEREGIARYFRAVEEAARLFPTYEYREEYDEADLKQALETSLTTIVQREIQDPRLQCVLYAYCSLHGVSPHEVSFGLHSLVTDSLLRGAHGFRAGGDALAESFVRVIEAMGGTVKTKCRVTELRVNAGEVTEVITDHGEVFQAEWIVSGIHPKATLRLIPEAHRHFRPAFLGRVANLTESPGILGVYATVSGPISFRPDRNYYFFGQENPSTLFAQRQDDTSPTMAFVATPRRVPVPGQANPLLFHAPGPMRWFQGWRDSRYGRRDPEYVAFKEARARELITFVDRFDPGLTSRINRFCVSTPVTNGHFNGSEDGSAYGIYHSMDQTGVRALGPRTHLKNLLLTGQNSLFPGLLGASISGLRTAGSLLGIKELLRELRALREEA